MNVGEVAAPRPSAVSNLGATLIRIAAIYMLAGLLMGWAMGVSENFSLASVHSHISLLGWTTMGLTGVVYLVMPDCSRSRLARLHFWGHNVGLPVMMAGLSLLVYGVRHAETAIAAGSTLVLISLSMFTVNVHLHHRRRDRALDSGSTAARVYVPENA